MFVLDIDMVSSRFWNDRNVITSLTFGTTFASCMATVRFSICTSRHHRNGWNLELKKKPLIRMENENSCTADKKVEL